MNRLHTFVIPAYNDSKYLKDLILSLKRQLVQSDIILTSSKETPYLKELSDEFDIDLVISGSKPGIGSDWNFALAQAKTPLVTIAHQDDIYLKDFTLKVIDAYLKDKNAAVYFTDYRELRDGRVAPDKVNLKIKKLLLKPLKLSRSTFGKRTAVFFGNAICCPSVTYNKPELDDFYFDEDLKSNLDWKAWIDLIKEKKKFNYIPRPLMLHRVHEESETSKLIKNELRGEEDLAILEEIWPGPIAKILGRVYLLSQKENKTNE